MGFNTATTYACGYTEAAFLRAEPSLKGDAVKLFFLGSLYIQEINKKMKPSDSLENLNESQLRKHKGTQSFSVPSDEIPDYIRDLKPGDIGILEYGLVPGEFKDRKTNQMINFMRLVFLGFKVKSSKGASFSSTSSSSISSSSSVTAGVK